MFGIKRNLRIVTQFKQATQFFKRRSVATSPNYSYSKEDYFDYCANLVKSHDYENYLATLLLTKAIRSPALVIRAFNVEIAKVQDHTSDPTTAQLRMQFWQNTISEIFKKDNTPKNITHNPVAQELFKVCSAHKLSKRNFEKLILSRDKLMRRKLFVDLLELEKYSDDTVSAVYYLLLSLAGVHSVHADHAASHLGKAQGLTNMLRSIYVTNHYKLVYVPMDILVKHRVSQEDVLRCRDSDNMRNCMYEIAISAHNHVKMARKLNVPELAKQIFLPALAVESYLKRLQKRNFNVFDKSLTMMNVTLPFSYYFMRLFNKY